MRPDEASSVQQGSVLRAPTGRVGAAARLALAGAGLALGLAGFLQTLAESNDLAAVPVREWLGLAATLVATAAAWRRWRVLLLAAALAHNVSESLPVLFGALCFFGAVIVMWFSNIRARRARVAKSSNVAGQPETEHPAREAAQQ